MLLTSFYFKKNLKKLKKIEKRYRDRGQEIGKYCPLPEPIRLQDSQDTEEINKLRYHISHSWMVDRAKMVDRQKIKENAYYTYILLPLFSFDIQFITI